MLIIGITGRAGAGKGEAANYLVKKGLKHYSVRDFLMREVARLGLPTTRDSALKVANDFRKKYSPSYLTEQVYKEAMTENKDCVIESLRHPAEIAFLSKAPLFHLIAIDANQAIRYQHIIKRNTTFDPVSFEVFVIQDSTESTSNNLTDSNITACIEQADFIIKNEGTTEKLFKKLGNVLKKIKK